MGNNKKLYEIEHGKRVCGVCGGIAEYLGVDATIIRIAWALLVCFVGTGFLLYFICAFIEKGRKTTFPLWAWL